MLAASRDEPGDHAVGRSRGGLSTKIHAAVDGRGRPLAILLTPGQAGLGVQNADIFGYSVGAGIAAQLAMRRRGLVRKLVLAALVNPDALHPGLLEGIESLTAGRAHGTTHITLVHRADWLTSMITEFLDAPMPDA